MQWPVASIISFAGIERPASCYGESVAPPQPGPAERSDGFLAQGNGVPVASAEGGHGAEGDVTIGFRVGFDVDWTPKAGRHTVPVGMWS